MCVGTAVLLSIPHAALYVSGPDGRSGISKKLKRFNAARSIVCVETASGRPRVRGQQVSMPHAALCVSGPLSPAATISKMLVSMPHAALCVSGLNALLKNSNKKEVSMPHAALCVSGPRAGALPAGLSRFQCRTRHYVCRDSTARQAPRSGRSSFNAARGIMCVGTTVSLSPNSRILGFQCRTRHYVCRDADLWAGSKEPLEFQCRTRHYVCRDTMASTGWSSSRRFQCRTRHYVCRDMCSAGLTITSSSFNAARGIMCVGTMCPAALVPRGLRRRFGKTKRRNAALRQRRSTFHFLLLYDSTRFVLFQ